MTMAGQVTCVVSVYTQVPRFVYFARMRWRHGFSSLTHRQIAKKGIHIAARAFRMDTEDSSPHLHDGGR